MDIIDIHTQSGSHLDRTIVVFTLHSLLAFSVLVDGGQRAVIFDRFRGVLPLVSGEGTHFLIPWVQKPIIFSIRSRPRRVPVVTGSKGKGYFVLLGAPVVKIFLSFVRFTEC